MRLIQFLTRLAAAPGCTVVIMTLEGKLGYVSVIKSCVTCLPHVDDIMSS